MMLTFCVTVGNFVLTFFLSRMKRQKHLIYILAVVNVVLLLAIGAVVGSRIRQTEQQASSALPEKGKKLTEILNDGLRIRDEVSGLQTRKKLVLLFFRDSSLSRSREYLHEFSKCVSSSPIKLVSFVIVCAPHEKCENIRVFEVENVREPFRVRYYSDQQNNFRRRFDVHHGATIIADAQTWEVSSSYGYVVNPFVLCELLQEEGNNAQ